MTSLRIRKLSAGSVYKLIGLGSLCGMVPLFVLIGLFADLGLITLRWNNAPLAGTRALLEGPLIGVLATLLTTVVIGSIVAFGLGLYARIASIMIGYTPIAAPTQVARKD